PKKGAKIKGKIVKIGEEAAFVDFGGREEAALDLQEIRDPDGKLTRKVGDEVRGAVTHVEGGIKMSLRAGRSLPKNLPLLIQAAAEGTPVEGKITSVNKGGLVVHVMGVRGFCPFSQVDRHYVEDPTTFVGKKLTFRVASADDKGRNVVLSRRALMEEEAKVKAEEIRASIAVDQVLKGTVARIRPFGAFVDLGGIDGLLHVSEISHTRIHDPSAVLKLGQDVEVKVRSVENLGTKEERIGLSMKELADDPWETVASKLEIGTQVPAKVVRLAPFGAFLELAPGVDGLAHVSTLAEGHVADPADVVSVGQAVEPWVVSVDSAARRISLSLLEPTGEEEMPRRRGGGGGGGRREDRGRRDAGPREHKSMPASGPGMTSMEEAFERLRNQQSN
ncbi:S1 RNA-binding domain-containing protein, partial [bacterium]|nr:S1 RNA-binding domain-containing protein [bacterium]